MWTPTICLTGQISVRKSVRILSKRSDIYLADFLIESLIESQWEYRNLTGVNQA